MSLPPVANIEIITRHLSWVRKGYSFDDIQAIRRDIQEYFPYSPLGTRAIQKRIGGICAETEISRTDLEKLTYLLVDDCGFDANLQFLEYTRNLENVFVSGRCLRKKICDLKPLEHLRKLKKLQLEHQEIKDVSALAGLEDLTEVGFYNNPIETIRPLLGLQKIEKAEFSEVREEEVFQLLQNSQNAEVSFTSPEDGYCYIAYWMGNWAFKTTYFKDHDKVFTTIEPIKGSNFEGPTLPENLKTMLRKSKQIATSLMGEHQNITGSEFSYVEKSQLLKGHFRYRSIGPVKFDVDAYWN